jgi:hypothetical protein
MREYYNEEPFIASTVSGENDSLKPDEVLITIVRDGIDYKIKMNANEILNFAEKRKAEKDFFINHVR